MAYAAAVITVSDLGSKGLRQDTSDPAVRAMLSRAVAGTRGRSLIINLPGSEKAARENLSAVIGALEHAMHIIAAEGHG
mgnify:CR=1 FL=1